MSDPRNELIERVSDNLAYWEAQADGKSTTAIISTKDIRALLAAIARTADGPEPVALPFIVKYRRKDDGVVWLAMAAFDREGPAKRYCASCAAESSPWEYCVVEVTHPVPDGPAPAVSEAEVEAAHEAYMETEGDAMSSMRAALEAAQRARK